MNASEQTNYLGSARKGASSELLACAWLLSQNYDVFRNVSLHGAVDLVALNWREQDIRFIDVKSSYTMSYDNGNGAGVSVVVVEKDGSVHWAREHPRSQFSRDEVKRDIIMEMARRSVDPLLSRKARDHAIGSFLAHSHAFFNTGYRGQKLRKSDNDAMQMFWPSTEK